MPHDGCAVSRRVRFTDQTVRHGGKSWTVSGVISFGRASLAGLYVAAVLLGGLYAYRHLHASFEHIKAQQAELRELEQ